MPEINIDDCFIEDIIQRSIRDNLIEYNKKLFLDFSKKIPKITFTKPEMCTFEDMLEFKSINPSSL